MPTGQSPHDPRQQADQQVSQGLDRTERAAAKAAGEATTTLEMLRTQTDRVRGLMSLFGFGRRILVPPDEIHVVVGDGHHIALPSKKSRVFGQTADRASTYWLNRLSQVIKLKTISFTVPLRGENDEGVEVLDSSKVSFRLWAHAVAKLNPEKAEVAAQRVGLDATSLINTITEVGTSELIAAAAVMTLEEIIADRQKLAAIAFPQVNQILSELGYDLALLTVTRLDGSAYQKLVNQARARISKETSIATNREQVVELQDGEARQRQEAEIRAQTEKKLAAERLEAEREVETATVKQQDDLAMRRHEVNLRQAERDKVAARAAYEVEIEKVQLSRQQQEAEVERDAEVKSQRIAREARIQLAVTEADAERLALEQARRIEREAENTLADAKRLEQEELARAQRARQVALVQAEQLADALRVESEAESKALAIQVDAETKAELVRAESEATATEKRAQAAKIRAEATRAEAAAHGLAEAEVESARVEVAEKQVEVNRAEGLAQAAVAKAQAEAEAERLQRLRQVEIDVQRALVKLYDEAPVLVDLEKLKMQFDHEQAITRLQMETYLKAFEALAPSLQVRIYGSGDQTGRILTDLMSLAQGVNYLGDEVPMVKRVLSGESRSAKLLPRLSEFAPYIREALSDVNARMFSSLRIADLVERLVPVVAGQEDLTAALNQLREDATFRVVGDLPVMPLLKLLGVQAPEAEEIVDDETPEVVAGDEIPAPFEDMAAAVLAQ